MVDKKTTAATRSAKTLKIAKATAKVPPRPSAKRAAKSKTAKPLTAKAEVKQNLTATRDSVSKLASETTAQFKSDAARLTEDAGTKAKSLARDGKDKAASAIASFAKYIEDSASGVDDKMGEQYGEYARTAAASIASLATTVEKQDIDELLGDTRDFVRKSPAIAIGTAAVAGFIIARMLKGGSSDA